ncbi:MAG: hypothetical protein A2V77_16530 [Anaeromyxobacter sp. RBG_16_69_14]|nr:MAG: hypothetical protein A2V77_16530 [Anaeromyxobacter sp. RBG_16_69_14]
MADLAPGDEVFGETITDHQWHNGGAFAEYVSVQRRALARKPARVSFEQAATVPTSGMIALYNLRHLGELAPGQRVLVNGAGGCVGSCTVQLAKALGGHVTGVDTERKLELVRRLGADRAIDCDAVDFTRSGERYDLIVDIPGNRPFRACRRALAPRGRYVLIGHHHFGATGRRWLGPVPSAFALVALSPFHRQLPRRFPKPNRTELMATLTALLASGQLTPIIDRTFPLAEARAALRHLQEGQPCGRIVVTP